MSVDRIYNNYVNGNMGSLRPYLQKAWDESAKRFQGLKEELEERSKNGETFCEYLLNLIEK